MLEIERLKSVIARQEADIKNFSKELASKESLAKDYQIIKARFDELSDQLELTTAHNEELTLRLQGLE